MTLKVLVTGTTGMLGADIVRVLLGDPDYEVYGLGRRMTTLLPEHKQFVVDLASPQTIVLPDFHPDFIIHTAALTDLGLCERDPQLAERVHIQSSEVLADLTRNSGCFIYISTDSVFDGRKGGYTEADTPNPLNIYASTKFRGEIAVRNIAKKAMIIRTNIYGLHQPIGRSLTEWAYTEWMAGRKINGFPDIFFNAVFTGQLSEVLRYMMSNQIHYPIINVGSSRCVSKYEFLNMLAFEAGIDTALLEAKPSSAFPSTLKRPENTCLDTRLLKEFHTVPSFEDGLRTWTARMAPK